MLSRAQHAEGQGAPGVLDAGSCSVCAGGSCLCWLPGGLTRKEVTFFMRQKQAATMPQAVPMVPSQIGPPILVIRMLEGTCIVASE